MRKIFPKFSRSILVFGGLSILFSFPAEASQMPGAVFLMIWPGARPTSLAGAFTAISGRPYRAIRMTVGIDSIFLGAKRVITGTTITPKARWRNYSNSHPLNFRAFCFLINPAGDRVYVESLDVSGLEPGRDTTLTFLSFAFKEPGTWTLRCSTKAEMVSEQPQMDRGDAAVLYYNPGSLSFLNGTNTTLMHCNWLPGLWPGMYYEYLGFTHNLKKMGTAGFNFIYLTTGETDVINEAGVFLGRYTTFDIAPTIGYGFPVLANLGVGFSAKLIYSFLVPDWVWKAMPELGIESGGTGITWAFDGGVLYKPFPFLNVGMAVANLGPNIAYTSSGESDPLPRMLRVGLAYYPVQKDIFSLCVAPEISKILVGIFSDTTKSFSENLSLEWRDAWKSLGVEAGVNLDVVGFFARFGYFEDLTGQRGGIVLEKEGNTYHYGIWDVLTRKNLGRFKSLGFTLGGGIRFHKFQFDLGVDQFIYDFTTSNYKFSFSYQF